MSGKKQYHYAFTVSFASEPIITTDKMPNDTLASRKGAKLIKYKEKATSPIQALKKAQKKIEQTGQHVVAVYFSAEIIPANEARKVVAENQRKIKKYLEMKKKTHF